MYHARRTGILLAVALLIVGVAAPAAAKKGGKPGPPSGTGLEVTVEPTSGFMWANSVGDQILFDITVTNTSGALLEAVAVDFAGASLATIDLEKNQSWAVQHTYTVLAGDLESAPFETQTQVTVGTVTADNGTMSDSEAAVMTVYRVVSCGQDIEGGPFTFGPNADYSVCSFTGVGAWTLTTTLDKPPRGKSHNPSATVRDGVPGNWCMDGEPVVDGTTVIGSLLLPDDGTCLVGGAGGDEIPVRNTTTFYLATWKGNTVLAEPVTP